MDLFLWLFPEASDDAGLTGFLTNPGWVVCVVVCVSAGRSVTDVSAGVGFVYRCVFRSQRPPQDTEVARTCLTAVVTIEIWKKLHFQIKGQAKLGFFPETSAFSMEWISCFEQTLGKRTGVYFAKAFALTVWEGCWCYPLRREYRNWVKY